MNTHASGQYPWILEQDEATLATVSGDELAQACLLIDACRLADSHTEKLERQIAIYLRRLKEDVHPWGSEARDFAL